MPSEDSFFKVLYTVERDMPEFSTISEMFDPFLLDIERLMTV